MRLLDLFCGAGGASMGYHRAGFTEVVGVDLRPQPHYPFTFLQGDWLEQGLPVAQRWLAEGLPFAVHASPPCQAYSSMTKRWARSSAHPDLVAPTRELLRSLRVPYVIENVMGAPLEAPTMLCGSMFGLRSGRWQLYRHRIFEASFDLWPPASCAHEGPALPVYGGSGGSSKRDGLKFPGVEAWREGMGIDWMTVAELGQSIPPAYTQHIGAALLRALEEAA